VKLIPGTIPLLEFDIRVWGRYGSSSRPLRIPVPPEYEKEANEVIVKLKTKNIRTVIPFP
jgi:hypothetical protein